MASYRDGWKDGVRYVAAMIRSTSWDPETRKRLYVLAGLSISMAPATPPVADAHWRSRVPKAIEKPPPAKEPRKPGDGGAET